MSPSPAGFRDRQEAGRLLAGALQDQRGRDVLVLALPRGGVPVAYEVAAALHAPLDVLLVRKLGVPGHEELAMGAIAESGARVINDEVVTSLGIDAGTLERVTLQETRELERRRERYRGGRPAAERAGRTVLLVDDGLATGATMAAAVAAAREEGAARVVVAVPVASREAMMALRRVADECISLLVPRWFSGVGEWYEDFSQTTDDQVRALLDSAAREAVPTGAPSRTGRNE